jgi:hypothetical protein
MVTSRVVFPGILTGRPFSIAAAPLPSLTSSYIFPTGEQYFVRERITEDGATPHVYLLPFHAARGWFFLTGKRRWVVQTISPCALG